MPTFRYSAYGSSGDLAEGTIDAVTPDAANDMLWSQGLTPFRVQTADGSGTKWWNRDISFGGGNRRAGLLAFTREFATLNAAEIPLDDALRILREQASSARLRSLVDAVLAEILNGAPLSEALQKQGKMVPAEYIAVVRAGEIGGTLSDVLVELAELLERRAEIRSKIQSALIYPCMLVLLSLGTLAIIIGGLIPSIAPIFSQSGKPMPASIQFMLSLQENWVALVAGGLLSAALIAAGVAVAVRDPGRRRALDRATLRTPIVGSFLFRQEAARFARTLGTMLKAGVPLVQAAKSASHVIRNRHIAAGMEEAIEAVQQGAPLHRALRKEAVLPSVALQMISVGEESGKLDRMLLRVAVMLEQQLQAGIDRFMSALTPALTVSIAVLVGILIMPVMTAVLSINDLVAR